MRWQKILPYINIIQRLFHDLGINITWILSHAVDDKSPEQWSREEKSNYAADLFTKSRHEKVFQLYGQQDIGNNFEIINFNQEVFLSSIFQSSVYTFEKEGIPIADYQMKKEHRLKRTIEYLSTRQAISTRNIEWTETTIFKLGKMDSEIRQDIQSKDK